MTNLFDTQLQPAPKQTPALPLIGLKVRLDRPVDRERPCCNNVCVIGAGKGPHEGELICANCGQHRGWLSKTTAQWIEHVATRFGAPEIITARFGAQIITVHKAHALPEPVSESERRQRIELINRCIAAEGFAPKDFFLTQAPPPEETSALARWRTRERRRRSIGWRMAQWGLTAHDLTPVSGHPGKPPTATADLVSPAVSATANARGETAMAHIDEFYPSKFVRASDLKGKEITVTIDRVEAEEFEQDGVKRRKPVVHFRNSGIKPLVCNKTNSSRLATALGDKDTDAWAGKQVRLYPDMEEFRGQVHEVVRVRRAPPPIGEELNDEVPKS
jgi:hypothetical protein